MFEACFRMTALIESDGLGHTIFKVYERREPVSEDAFLSLIKATYEQRVSPLLQIGDDLTMILHVNLPNHEIERTVHVREDRQFEGDWLSEPTLDLFPWLSINYEHFRRQAIAGNVLTVTLRVQRF